MSKPRFSLYAEIDTLAHANTIKTNIQTQLVGKDIFETHGFGIYENDPLNPGKIILHAEWRFNNAVDRDTLKDWARDQIENHPQVKNWISKAKLAVHLCSHDDLEVKDCKTMNYIEWSKG